ncbi:MAG: PKD domain-containing protein [Chitinophagaceae bacterium]|nr:PKD domain-containing protein [Chitinophagaceae bacterium]
MANRQSSFRIDERVFLTMLVICGTALVLLAFRFATYKPCMPIRIVSSSGYMAVTTGELVRLSVEATDGNSFNWDFGDGNQKLVERYHTVEHTYKTPGDYTISVQVNGNCIEYIDIQVKEPDLFKTAKPLPVIISVDTVFAGEKIYFSDTSSGAESWLWHFGETEPGNVDAREKNPSYVYKTTGVKIIRLMINNDPEQVNSKYIEVMKKPEKKLQEYQPRPRPNLDLPDLPVSPPIVADDKKEKAADNEKIEPEQNITKAPEISTESFKALLMGIASGDSTIETFAPYLCDKLDMKISYDGKPTTFREACKNLKELSSKRIKEIKLTEMRIDKTSNCITSFKIEVKKKNFVERLFNSKQK